MDYPKVNKELCIGCVACVDMCPVDAIIMEGDKAVIVEKKCSNCHACENACPVEAIS